MTLGDRVAVMRAGVLQQVGTPEELYNDPVNLFVAGFIGSPGDELHAGHGRGRPAASCRSPTSRFPQALRRRRRARAATSSPASVRSTSRTRAARDRARPGTDVQGQDRARRVAGLGDVRALRRRGRRGTRAEELAELAADAGAGDVPWRAARGSSSRAWSRARRLEGGRAPPARAAPGNSIHLFDARVGGATSPWARPRRRRPAGDRKRCPATARPPSARSGGPTTISHRPTGVRMSM